MGFAPAVKASRVMFVWWAIVVILSGYSLIEMLTRK